jgi:hypothetical protein
MRLIYGRLWFLLLKLMDEKKRRERLYDYPINEKKSIWKEWSKFILLKPVMMKRKWVEDCYSLWLSMHTNA